MPPHSQDICYINLSNAIIEKDLSNVSINR